MAENHAPDRPSFRHPAFNPPEVENEAYGGSMAIPAAQVAQAGQGDVAPGEMAALIMQLPFKVAMENERDKSKAIEEMHHRTVLRDPLLRSKKYSAPRVLMENIEKKLANVESAMIQIVATEPYKKCNACEDGHGLWEKCLEVRGLESLTACGNCRWSENDSRCDFYRVPANQPQPQPKPKPANRRRRPAEVQRQRNAFADALAAILTDMQTSLVIAREEMQEIEGKFREIHALIHDRQLDDTRTLRTLRRILPNPMGHSQIVGRLSNIYDRLAELQDLIPQ